IGLLYTLPNFYGESPAVQIAGAKTSTKVDAGTMTHAEQILAEAGIQTTGASFEMNGPVGAVRLRFDSTDTQLKAKDLIEKTLNPDPQDPDYTVALNLMSASPNWLSALGAHPMYLGLDLRGGVHFLLQVDMQGALTSRYDSMAGEARTTLRDARLKYEDVERNQLSVRATFASAEARDAAADELRRAMPEI